LRNLRAKPARSRRGAGAPRAHVHGVGSIMAAVVAGFAGGKAIFGSMKRGGGSTTLTAITVVRCVAVTCTATAAGTAPPLRCSGGVM